MADSSPKPALADGEEHPSHLSDHALLRCIGQGSYGKVWLARSVLGTYRAIKIVYRRHFEEESPYEREFRGIQKFEPVSRSHEGLVNLLHVGRNDAAGYFYYIMELADDANGGAKPEAQGARTEEPPLDPARYEPKTLRSRMRVQGSPTFEECVELGLSLTSALDHLHRHQLIHRDLKPSNIIFVNGRAKIADIGLVADVGSSQSFVGTEGFIPPEGPGRAQADLYSLGKVLYEASTGLDRLRFPVLPDHWTEPSGEKWLELNEVLLKACEENTTRRYSSAIEMHSDLEVLRGGKSVKRLRLLERRVALMTRLLVAFGLLLFLAAGAYRLVTHAEKLTKQRLAASYVAYATRSVNENDLAGSLPWFAQALRLEQGDRWREQRHRIHLATVLQRSPKLSRAWFRPGEAEYGEFNPDGTRAVAAWSNKEALVWDVERNQTLLTLSGHQSEIRGAAFSPDGQMIATGSGDRTAKIWRAGDGQVTATLPHPAGVFSVKFHPFIAEQLLTAGADGKARLWDWKTGHVLREFPHHLAKTIRGARFNSDGRRLVTASEDGLAQVWDTASGQPVGQPMRHGSWVYDAVFSPDGQFVATATFDNAACLWEAETGRQIWSWPHEAAVGSVAFSPDGCYVATAAWDLSTRIWDFHRRSLRPAFPPIKHHGPIHSVRFDATGRRLITASALGVTALWDLAPANGRPQSVKEVYSGDGNRFVTLTNQAVQIWDASSRNAISSSIPLTNALHTVLLNQDASRALVCLGLPDGPGRTNIQARLWQPLAHPPRPVGVAFDCSLLAAKKSMACLSENGERLAVFHGKTGAVWHPGTGTLLRELSFKSNVESAALDVTGSRLALASGRNVELWETRGTNAPRLLTHAFSVSHVQFSPDGTRLVTSCRDATLLPRESQIWDVHTGQRLGPALKHRDGVWGAAFDRDGKRVVTASEDETAQVWDTATGRRLTPPMKQKFQVYDANFSPDGRWVVTGSRDKTARVWDAETGEPVTPPLPHERDVFEARFVANGQAVLTTDRDGRLWRWELAADLRPPEDLEQLAQLLSGHTVDPVAGAIPLPNEDLASLWHKLYAKYPDDFSVKPEDVLAWHEREWERSEADAQWTAAVFHLDQLLKLKPGDSRLLELRERLRARLHTTPDKKLP